MAAFVTRAATLALVVVLVSACGAPASATPERAARCLESGGADTVLDPKLTLLGGDRDLLVLRLAAPRVVLARLPSRAVVELGFGVDEAPATMEKRSSSARRQGDTFVLWAGAHDAEDEAAVLRCLRGHQATVAAAVKAPLGCLRVHFSAGATSLEMRTVERELRASRDVKHVEFVSAEDALEAMKKRFPELTKDLKFNPLPSSEFVQPSRGAKVERVTTQARSFPGVENVQSTLLPCDGVGAT